MNDNPVRKKPWYRLRNLILGALALIVLLLGWAFFEVWKVYTGEPKVTRDYRAEFRRLSEKAAGVPEGSGDEAWAMLIDATTECAAVIDEYEDRIERGEVPARTIPGDNFVDRTVDFGFVRGGPTIPQAVDREREVLGQLHERGVFDRLAEFAARGPGFRTGDSSVSMIEEFLPELSGSRTIAKARVASMRIALEQGNHAEVARAVNELLCMSRTLSHQPGLICSLVAQATNALMLSELKMELMEADFDGDTCRELLRALDQQRPADVSLTLKGEQAAFHDLVQRFFTEDGRGNRYIDAKTLQTISGDATSGPPRSLWGSFVGRYALPSGAQTIARYDEFVALCLKELALPESKRWRGSFDPDKFVDALHRREAIVKLVIPAVEKSFTSISRGEQDYEATRVMVALELFYALHKRWPASVNDLAPEILPQPPRDPLHGGAFGYRLLDNDLHRRPYLLYSFGLDEQDDRGRAPSDEKLVSKPVSDRSVSGFDFVFNTSRSPSPFDPQMAPGEVASDGTVSDDAASESDD